MERPSRQEETTPLAAAVTTSAVPKSNAAGVPTRDWSVWGLPDSAMKLSLEDAEAKMQKDGIFNQDFYKKAGRKVKAAIHFIYGLDKPEYAKMTVEERISRITALVQDKGAADRLCSVAVSDPKDGMMVTEEQTEAYIHMAKTVETFCDAKAMKYPRGTFILGGFPEKPILRIQKSRNCFHSTSVVHLSLLKQKRKKGSEPVGVLDAAQVARHYLLYHPGALEKRVLENKGRSTIQFASNIARTPFEGSEWRTYDTSTAKYVFEMQHDIASQFKESGHGLVTEFRVGTPFQKAAFKTKRMRSQQKLGYVLFDGNNVDTVGEWVSFDGCESEKLQNLEQDLRNHLQKQNQTGIKLQNEIKEKLRDAFPPPTKDESLKYNLAGFENCAEMPSSQGANPDPPSSQGNGTHTMVLLGIRYNRRGEFVFLLLNSWSDMPLVAVTIEYMQACGAKVTFLKTDPNIDPDLTFNTALVADCVAPNDFCDGDRHCPPNWFKDAFGFETPDPMTFEETFRFFLNAE